MGFEWPRKDPGAHSAGLVQRWHGRLHGIDRLDRRQSRRWLYCPQSRQGLCSH